MPGFLKPDLAQAVELRISLQAYDLFLTQTIEPDLFERAHVLGLTQLLEERLRCLVLVPEVEHLQVHQVLSLEELGEHGAVEAHALEVQRAHDAVFRRVDPLDHLMTPVRRRHAQLVGREPARPT